MEFLNTFTEISFLTIIALMILSFSAGFIDSIVGGGGLIQVPALLINLPNNPLPTLLGTNKISASLGTSVAAYQYSRKVKYDFKLLITISTVAFLASSLGAKTVSIIDTTTLKPLVLIILIIIAVYTFINKNLGSTKKKDMPIKKQFVMGSLLGFIIGFYDGFFGPGTGSFLVLGFVVILGFEFLKASAYAKIINVVANISALIVFIQQGHFLLGIGLMMAVCNIAGNIVGSKLAIKKGNRFIRIVFLIIVSIMILRYGYDIFIK